MRYHRVVGRKEMRTYTARSTGGVMQFPTKRASLTEAKIQ